MKYLDSFEQRNESMSLDAYRLAQSDDVKFVNTLDEVNDELNKLVNLKENEFIVFGYENYRFIIGRRTDGQPTCMTLKHTPKAKYSSFKTISHYRYNNDKRLIDSVNQFIQRDLEIKDDKAKREEAKKQARANMNHGFKVGDILYSSFGYEQTNVDFWQITKVGGKSVWLRPIKSKIVGETGPFSADVAPVKDAFTGEEVRKPVTVSVWGNNKPSYHVKDPRFSRYNLYLYDRGEKGIHSSWGH